MLRRFVNLVSHKWCGPADSSTSIYSLHRIDVAGELFYPSSADAKKANAEAANKEDGGAVSWPSAIKLLKQLPAPTMTFQAASRTLQTDANVLFFALLNPRDSESQILFSNKLGHSVLYDADANCVTTMPTLSGQLGCRPITISLALPGGAPELKHDLYVMHNTASTKLETCCFSALRFGETMGHNQKAWRWDPLPAPPLGSCTPICSHAVVDGGQAICVSAQSVPGYTPSSSTNGTYCFDTVTGQWKCDAPSSSTDGTYCFDTVKREWKCAGDWILPFEGGAIYVQGLGDGDLWLGFDGNGRNLCAASGLSAAMETAPARLHVWPDAGKVPANWRTTCPMLLDLGGGRFCIAKTCFIMPDTEYDEYSGRGIEVAVLSGVELLNGGGDRIDMVEHKSLGYMSCTDSIRWVV